MGRKRFTVEKILGMLRDAEVVLAQAEKVGEVCRSLGVSEQAQRRAVEPGGVLYPEGGEGRYREVAA